MIGFVYVATCKATNKCYVGYDTSGKRRKYHMQEARSNPKLMFHRALRKYNDQDLWEWDIVGISKDKNELKHMEIQLIAKHNSFDKGYNMTKGGDGSLGVPCSEETRKKISESKKGHPHPPHVAQAMLEGLLKKGPWNKGKVGVYTPQQRKKYSDAQKRRFAGTSGTFKGKHHTKETKQQMALSARMRKRTPWRIGNIVYDSQSWACIFNNKSRYQARKIGEVA